MDSQIICCRLDEYHKKIFDYLIEAEGIKKSKFIQDALENHFEKTFANRQSDPQKQSADEDFIRKLNSTEIENIAKRLLKI